MLTGVRYFFSDVFFWIRSHPIRGFLGLLVLAALVAGGIFAGTRLGEDAPPAGPAPAPDIFVEQGQAPEAASDLGFPAFATRNTTRVAGADPTADAAGVALATFPTGGVVKGPAAVSLVDSEDWAAGIAASSLVAQPVSAPILLTEGDNLPDLTTSALDALKPGGGAATGGAQAFTLGGAAAPDGLEVKAVQGDTAADVAAAVADLRQKLTGSPPDHLLIATSDDPEYAMPAAAWAARSGDPVLFAQADSVPSATLKVIEDQADVPVYILGSEGVISKEAEKEIAKASNSQVTRAATEDDPLTNAVSFARFIDGSFGWNINDPGHGFVIANLSRPADAGAAAALSGSGTWGPLLLTDDAEETPSALQGFLLDLKPGYEDDPTRAVYNHIWIVGDETAVSIASQVELDTIAEAAQVESGSGDALFKPDDVPEPESNQPPAKPKDEPKDDEKP